MTIKIKFIKDTEKFKVGEIAEASKESADSYVENGYAEYVKEIENKILSDIDIVKKFGIGRTDFYWLYDKKGIPKNIKKQLTNEIIKKHTRGEIILGCSPFVNNEKVGFCSLDFDTHLEEMTEEQKTKKRKEVIKDYNSTLTKLKKENYCVLANPSGGDIGKHLRIYTKDLLGKDARVFLAKLQIDLFGKLKYEIFPKQNNLSSKKQYGNQMKLFLGTHPKYRDKRTDLLIDGKQLTYKKSIEYLKNVLTNFKKYKKIEVSKEDYEILEKNFNIDISQIDTDVPLYCEFIEKIACKKVLTSGYKTRHQNLDPNIAAYCYRRPEKQEIKNQYKKIQGRDDSALDNWKNYWIDGKPIFNLGQIISYLIDRKNDGDINAKEGLEMIRKDPHFLKFKKNVVYKLISEISIDDDILKIQQIQDIFEEIYLDDNSIFIGDCKKKISDKTGIGKRELDAELKKIRDKNRPVISDALDIFGRWGQAEEFYKKQPFFYDENKLWWIWNFETSSYKKSNEINILNYIKHLMQVGIIESKARTEIINVLKHVGRTKIPEKIPDSWVQFKDTIYDVASNEIFKATPKYFVVNPIPHKLGNSEKTPKIDKLFVSWVGENHKQELYEITAFCCVPNYFIHRVFFFFGKGANGKGTYDNLLTIFLGEDNTTTSSIERLIANPRFETSKFYKKLVVFLSEISVDELKKSDTLKQSSGGEPISGEFKGKTGFNFLNYAKVLIPTNKVPKTFDISDGFFRRIKIIDFPNQFPKEKDVLSGIPDWEFENLAKKSLRIAKELWENRIFTNDGDFAKRRKRYLEKSMLSIEIFINVHCDQTDINAVTPFSEFFVEFNKYLKINNKNLQNQTEIGKSLKYLGWEKKPVGKKREDGSWTTEVSILNLKLKSGGFQQKFK